MTFLNLLLISAAAFALTACGDSAPKSGEVTAQEQAAAPALKIEYEKFTLEIH